MKSAVLTPTLLPGLLACTLLAGCVPGVVAGVVVPEAGPTIAATVAPPSPVPSSASTTATHGPAGPPWTGSPPPFVVRYGTSELRLAPFTYCYHDGSSGVCADGFDNDPPSIGSPDEVFVLVPVAEFDQLEVSLTADEESGADAGAVPAKQLGDHWWLVRPHAKPGSYRLTFFASGGGAGDMVADVLWQASDRPVGRAQEAPGPQGSSDDYFFQTVAVR